MTYSCADFTFPVLTHDQVLDLLRVLEFRAVDLGIFEQRSHVQPGDIVPDPVAAALRMREKLAARDMVAVDVFLQTGPEPAERAANDTDPSVRRSNRDVFESVLRFALALGAKHITGLPGVWHEGVARESDWSLAVDETRWRTVRAAQDGIVYAFEPHVGSLCGNPEDALRFASESETTVTLDYGHFVYQGMDQSRVHPLIPHASHFHARGGAPGQLQSTVKDNIIDFPEILRRMKSAGYAGALCLEYVWVDWEGCNRTDNVAETVLLRRLLEQTLRGV